METAARLARASISSFFLFPLVLVLAVYDSTRPHRYENFDPAEADPLGSIRCEGPLPYRLPRYPFWPFDPNTFTLQQLCAKPQYGGRGPGQHLSGFCSDNQYGVVAFDDSEQARRAVGLCTPRLWLYCRLRCFCDYNFPGEDFRPPDAIAASFPSHLVPSSESYRITVHRVDHEHWDGQASQRGNGYGDLEVLATDIDLDTQVAIAMHEANMLHPDFPDETFHALSLSIDPRNNISCAGPLPSWPAPVPWQWSEFSNLQELCAVQLAGGNEPVDKWSLSPEVEVVMNIAKGRESNGSIEVQVRGKDGSLKTAIPVLPAITVGVPFAAGTCGPQRNELCAQRWPTDVLGPIPTAPPGASPRELSVPDGRWPIALDPTMNPSTTPADLAGSVTPAELPTCGATCRSNQDCRGNGEPSSCRCLAIGEPVARQAGVDPVFPPALCLIFSATLGTTLAKYAKPLPKRGGEIEGQGADRHTDAGWGCVCNATYISKACCETDKGVVWEDSSLKLGRLTD
ncbi:MAG: hypothetical protein M1817_004577 [Caeruleum heppii]|nr:MAG: hypothetical protein M1817_004577 [Caeruleum heppii]